MTSTKYVLSWLFFMASYVMFMALAFIFLPENWLWDKVHAYHTEFIPEGMWDDIFMSTVFLVSLILNIAFIYLVFAVRRLIKKTPTAVP